MLRLRGRPQRLCDGVARRDFLQLGALGSLGLGLPALLRASAARPATPARTFGKAKRCLLLFLTGGPPQHDTWDLKPAAPERIRGELKPIATNVPGIQISELFPRLARHADKVCIVRSVTRPDRTHTSAGYTMLTGVDHPLANAVTAANIRPGPQDHPHIGSLLAKVRRPRNNVPVFASLPEVIKDAGVNQFPGLDGGMLGSRYAPFRIETNPTHTGFEFPDIFLPPDMTPQRLADRRALLGPLDRGLKRLDAGPIRDMDAWHQKAFDALRSPAVREAFALEREPVAVREAYGNHLFGQGCLLARRLLEAGVGLAAVYWHYEGPDDSPVWDTHQNNFPHLRKRLMPPTDQAFAALLGDLSQRGLLDDTLVVCMGEFGRTPLINKFGGRDHWSAVHSLVIAGAGIRAGSIYGASDRDGANPAEKPVVPADLTATLMHLLGIPEDLEIVDRTGRGMRACQGRAIAGILT
ncbi:MAG TPA: DUF1501 domain-containing protein [Gemmataceae bacterium]|nr:DUF1501 domain-containing protein [Gemmataceae bacterium]